MKRRAALALLACIMLAAAAALAVLPARWLMLAVPGHWPLTIVDARGTVWSGSATLALGPEPGRRALPHPLRWEWSFTHGPRMEVRHPWLEGPLTLAPDLTGLVVSSQTLRLPAQALGALDARIAAIDPGGILSLAWPATHIGGDARPAGTRLLGADWRDASSALTPIHPLGDYAVVLKQGDGGAIELLLETRGGPLLLEGSGSLEAGRRARFQGTARADPAAGPDVRAALQDVLGALGPRQNDVTLLQYR